MKKVLFYLLIFLCGLIYIPSFNNPFLWDDAVVIRDNPFIGSQIKIKVKDFFSKNYFSVSKEVTYRPVATALYYLIGFISGKNPAGYKAVNMILNIIAGILVMVLGSRFFGSVAGLFAGLLFVMHPIHSETVFIASFNEDILMTVFLLAAFLFYMNYRKKGNNLVLVFSTTCFLLSCLSKETGIVFLGILIFYEEICHGIAIVPQVGFSTSTEFVPLKAGSCNNNSFLTFVSTSLIRNKWVAYGMYLIVTFIYVMFRFVIFSHNVPSGIKAYFPETGYFGGSFLSNLIIVISSTAEYVKLALFPFNLQVERIWNFDYFEFLAGFILLGWILFSMFRYRKGFGFWIAIFIVPLLPVFNIVPFFSSPVIGERYLYLSTVGICVIAGMLLRKVPSKIGAGILLSVLVLFAATILERGSDYKNELSFWKKAVVASPESFKAQNSLGNAYKYIGNFEGAEFHYRRAIEIRPDYAEAMVNLGGLYDLWKKYEQAEKFYLTAAKLNPFLVKAYSGLGILYMKQNKFKEAEELLKKAVELDGSLIGAYYFLGKIYEWEGRSKEVIVMYDKVIEYSDMDVDELNNIGLLAANIGEYDKAVKYFQKAIKSNPKYLNSAVNLANTYFMMKKYNKAEELYLKVLKIEPKSIVVVSNLKKVRNMIASQSKKTHEN